MNAPQLRIYYGPPASCDQEQPYVEREEVRVALGDILPALVDAYQSRRAWLRDFQDEEVVISADLHELILAYRFYRRPSA